MHTKFSDSRSLKFWRVAIAAECNPRYGLSLNPVMKKIKQNNYFIFFIILKSKNEKDLAKIGKVQVFTTRWNDLSAYKIVALYFNREKQKMKPSTWLIVSLVSFSFCTVLALNLKAGQAWMIVTDGRPRTVTVLGEKWPNIQLKTLMDTVEQFRVFLNLDFLQ